MWNILNSFGGIYLPDSLKNRFPHTNKFPAPGKTFFSKIIPKLLIFPGLSLSCSPSLVPAALSPAASPCLKIPLQKHKLEAGQYLDPQWNCILLTTLQLHVIREIMKVRVTLMIVSMGVRTPEGCLQIQNLRFSILFRSRFFLRTKMAWQYLKISGSY